LAIVQTVDFFTPIVDDPRTFGRIAAANSLSDVYAMGGTPVTALNVVAFPLADLGADILGEILAGGLEKIHEAGACLVGGHSVEDAELKYGLAVTGTVHPDRVLRNGGARPGDALVLTKPLGTGAIATALKKGSAPEASVSVMTESMAALNRDAAEEMCAASATGCTDITGYGMLGHAVEMARASGATLVLEVSRVPALPGATDCLEGGAVCGGTKRNASHFGAAVDLPDGLDAASRWLLYDAQTSGGLLVSLPEDRADGFVERARGRGATAASVVGRVEAGPPRVRVER